MSSESLSGCASSTDDEERWREAPRKPEEIPSAYWALQKLIKYVKTGNAIATNLCLCCIRGYDLSEQINQKAIHSVGGLEVLVNLLDSNYLRCRLGALHILNAITGNLDVRRYVIDLNAIQSIARLLNEPASDIKTLAALVLSNLAMVRLARKIGRNEGTIQPLVAMMDCSESALKNKRAARSQNESDEFEECEASSRAMSVLLLSKRNILLAEKCGIFSLIKKLLQVSDAAKLNISVLRICQVMSCRKGFQTAIETEQMIPGILLLLRDPDDNIKREACEAIHKCAVELKTAQLVYEHKGIPALLQIIQEKTKWEDAQLLKAAMGALRNCSMLEEVARQLDEKAFLLIAMEVLSYTFSRSDNTTAHTCGVIARLLRIPKNIPIFCSSEKFAIVVDLLNFSNEYLLESASTVLKECSKVDRFAKKLDELDGTRLLWSLLCNKKPEVKANASWALCEYVLRDAGSPEVIRSFVNGLELLTHLLKVSKSNLELAATCALIAEVAKDSYNLAILTDYLVIPLLAKLVTTDDDLLQEYVASAIASCCSHGSNTKQLGELRTVAPIVRFLAGTSKRVHRTAAMALERLSADPLNCVTMHQCGVVAFLIESIESDNKDLQNAAAKCLQNVRSLSLEAEINKDNFK